MAAPKKATVVPIERFEFLNTVDGETYTLPPYDAEKFVDELKDHADFIPKASLTDALLDPDPQAGLDSLNAPARAINVLMKRAMLKTLRNHLEDTDPAWLALTALVDASEFDVLEKIFLDWRKASGDIVGDGPGED